jgi:hypothetical protein
MFKSLLRMHSYIDFDVMGYFFFLILNDIPFKFFFVMPMQCILQKLKKDIHVFWSVSKWPPSGYRL